MARTNRRTMSGVKNCMMALLVMMVSAFPAMANAETIEERPGGAAMALDAVFVRPVQAVATAMGATIYVLSLPFSLMGGNAGEAGKNMVIIPFRATVLRCLGCTNKHVREYE